MKHILKCRRWLVNIAAMKLAAWSCLAQAENPVTKTNSAGYFTRMDRAFRDQLGQQACPPPDTNAPAAGGTNAPGTVRRVLPSPFDSPPYCTSEWQLGGTPTIGDPNDATVYPLMQALYDGPNGEFWKNSRVQFYGWEDFSGNISSSHNTSSSPSGILLQQQADGRASQSFSPGQGGNFPEIYDVRPNRLEQDQLVLYAERLPNTAQTDHIDWGFRVSGLYGEDYRYMIARGLFSEQLLEHNNYLGFDMPMIYADVYIPWVAEGMNVRVGRIISEPDIEAQLAPDNLMFSHSLLYSYDPYTQEGIFTSTRLSKNWIVQAGICDGNDIAIWQKDPGNQPTGTVMLQYTTSDNKMSIYAGANAFNNGEFGYNNLQAYVGTISYKFNDWIWTSHETWYMYQHHATTAPTASVPYNNGFYPVKAGYAPEWATVNYIMFRLGSATFLSVRNEIFDDIVGQRTGFATTYSEHAVGLTWWPDKLITVRPEVRFDHAYNALPYDNGTRHSQLTLGCDVIFHF